MSPLSNPFSNRKVINEVIKSTTIFLGKLLKRNTPGAFDKQEQELINFSYQTATE